MSGLIFLANARSYFYALRNSSGSFAIFAAIRRAASRLGWALAGWTLGAAHTAKPPAMKNRRLCLHPQKPCRGSKTAPAGLSYCLTRGASPARQAKLTSVQRLFCGYNGQSPRIDFDVENVAASLRGLTQNVLRKAPAASQYSPRSAALESSRMILWTNNRPCSTPKGMPN
jgi:hypothetical protein